MYLKFLSHFFFLRFGNHTDISGRDFGTLWEGKPSLQVGDFSLYPMFQHAGGNWPVGHMRRLSLRAAKGGDAAGDARVTAWHGKGREREGKRVWVYVFPHYKFNLTNGSENLETMEYMKCGRVYHADGGDAGWYRRQYCQGRSIFSESAAARGPSGVRQGGERGRKWFPPELGGRASGKTCSWHDKKSRAER